MARIFLFCVLICICLQLVFSSPRITRDTTEHKTPDVSKEIDDALKVLRTNFDHLLKTVQDNEMFKGLNEKVQQLSVEIAAQGKQIAERLQEATNT